MTSGAGVSNKPNWRSWVLNILLVVFAVTAIHYWQTRNLLQGKAPDMAVEAIPVLHSDSLPEKPRLVHFWATWCPICRFEQSGIQALSAEFPLVTVAVQSGTLDQVRAYMGAEGISFPTLIDEGGELARTWGVRGFPATFVLDGQGNIRFRTVGYTTGWGLRMRLWMAGFY